MAEKTVETRSVRHNGSSLLATVPKDIADELELDDGETVLWEYNGDGVARVQRADRAI